MANHLLLHGLLLGASYFGIVLTTIQASADDSDFIIPFPFGNFSVSKGKNGETNVGLQNGLNIMGSGAQSGMTFTSKNGSLTTKTSGGILVKGQEFGTNSTFGADKKKGLQADTDLNLGQDGTIHGGLGKENQAINDLGALAKKNKEQAADRKRKQQRRWGD